MEDGYIRVLVVSDDASESAHTCAMLREDPEIEVIGEHPNVVQAVSVIPAQKPDLLFVDVQIPSSTDFSALDAVEDEEKPFVIAAARHDECAIQAYKLHALDFLLKPFARDLLERSLRRAKLHVRWRKNAEVGQKVLSSLGIPLENREDTGRIMIRCGGNIAFVRLDEIDWVEAQGDYVQLHVHARKYLLREKIGKFEQNLPTYRFMRIHRSAIVNIDKVKEMQPLEHGECVVILVDGTRLTLSRSFREKVFRRFSNAS